MSNENPIPNPNPTALVPAVSPDAGMMDVVDYSQTRQTNALQRVHSALRGRYWLAIILAILGAAGGAWLGYTVKPPKYESTGVIRFKPILPKVLYSTEQNSQLPMFDAYMDVQVNLLTSQRVIHMALQDPKWIETRQTSSNQQELDFTSSLTVTHVRGSELVMVTFADMNPIAAQRGAAAVIHAYEAISDRDDDTANLMPHLQSRQSDLTNQLKAINERMLGIGKDFGSNTLDAVYQNKLQQLNQLESRMHEADLAVAQSTKDPTAVAAPAAYVANTNPSLAQSPDYQNLMTQRRNIEMLLDEERIEFLEKNPAIQKTEAQLVEVNKFIQQMEDATTRPSDPLAAAAANNGTKSREQLEAQQNEITKLYTKLREETILLGQKCVELQDLQRQAADTKAKLDETNRRIDELNVESGVSGRFDAEDPDIPLAPLQDKRATTAAFGGVAGSILGAGLIFGFGLIDRRVRHITDVSARLTPGLRVLGVLPNLKENENDPIQAGLAAQAVHQIRTLVQRRRPHGERTVLTITSPSPGAGKTSLSVALGLSFASSGSNTLVIDCDIIGGGLTARLKKMTHRRIGRVLRNEGIINTEQLRTAIMEARRTSQRVGEVLVKDGLVTQEQLDRALQSQETVCVGLHEAIHGDPLPECVAFSGTPRLWIMPLGSAKRRHSSQLTYASLVRILDQARKEVEVVIIDTGPILGSLEGLVAAMAADEVVLTIARGEHSPAVDHAVHYLTANGANLVGVVLNRADSSDIARSGYSSSVSRRSQLDSASAAEDLTPVELEGLNLGPVGAAVASLTDCGVKPPANPNTLS